MGLKSGHYKPINGGYEETLNEICYNNYYNDFVCTYYGYYQYY